MAGKNGQCQSSLHNKKSTKPVPSTIKSYEIILTRDVHKNNTIFYKGNRYTLPMGTYRSGRKVTLDIEGDILKIRDDFDGYLIAEHKISKSKGQLVQNNNHKRDNTKKLDDLQDNLLEKLGSSEDACIFLTQIRCLKSRYASLMDQTISDHTESTVKKALEYCLLHSLFSAVEFPKPTFR